MSFPFEERTPAPHLPIQVTTPAPGGAASVFEVYDLPPEIADGLPMMLWKCDAEGCVTIFNRRWREFTGYSAAQALDEGWNAAVHQDDRERRLAAREKARESKAVFDAEYRLRAANGGHRRVLELATPVCDAQGNFRGYAGVLIDKGPRESADARLRWLSQAVEQSPAMVMITDLRGRIEYVNPKFTEVTGYTVAEVRGRNPRFLKSGETPAEEYRRLWRTIQSGEWRGEFHNRKKNGELYWESTSISPIRDEAGRPTHFIAVKEDISERKRMEAELRVSEQRFRIAAEAAEICVYDVDMKTGKAQAFGSDQFLTNIGPSGAWEKAVHPDDWERMAAAIEQRRKNNGEWREEYRLVDSQGRVRYCLDYGAPECDGRWIGALRDITRAQQAEEALCRLAAIVQCSEDAIISLDQNGAIQTWNAAAERLYGYSAGEAVGQPGALLSHPARRDDAARKIRTMLSGEPLLAYEVEHMRKDGNVFSVSITGSPIRDLKGNPVGGSVFVRDVTSEKQAQQKLIESENRFRALLQNNSDVVTLMDATGKILWDTQSVFQLLGVTPEQRLGRPQFEWLHPEEIPYMQMLHEELRRQPNVRLRAQLRLRHADGSWRWCDSWASNLLDEPGVHALVVSFRDITDLKGVETALRESELRYRKLVEDASDVIFTMDLDGHLTSVNQMGERLSGYSRQELLGMNVEQITAPEYRLAIRRAVEARRDGKNPPPLESGMIARDGHRVTFEVSARLQFRNGAPSGILCIARDISQRKRVERLEQNRREVLEMVAQNQSLSTVLRRVEEMVEHYYPGAEARIALADGDPGSGWDTGGTLSAKFKGHVVVPIRAGGSLLGNLEIFRKNPWQPSDSEQVLFDSQARLAGIALEHRQLTRRLSYQAQHDPLTSLPNRALLEDRLQQALTLAIRQARMVAVLYVDLDRFKFINDTLGHHIGDVLLQQAAKRLEGAVRACDTLARPGGDEFVAVMSGIESVRDAEAVGERIVAAMRDPFEINGHELFASASVGLSMYPEDGTDAATLQKHADLAMYEAKSQGGNRFHRFARELDSATTERLEIENQLHWALDRNELMLYYQPLIELPSRRIAAVEALLRWKHPKWGLVLPNRFVPIAEDTGLIIPIGLWVLREACRQHRVWRQMGYAPAKIAVNISATQFMRSNLAGQVGEILTEFEMEPRYLELELTEGVLMRDAADTSRQIAELRELGVRISVDDFGTGYSSLSYLQRLPIDDLKIDKCFVQGIDQPSSTEPLVKAIVGLAHGLNLTATAEGVETPNQLAVLQALGCDQVQGFLLGEPMPAEDWERYWRGAAPVA